MWWELTIGLATFLVCTTLSNLSVGDKQASGEPDWSWHIVQRGPVAGAGRAGSTDGVRRLATEVASEPLPEDRPRWRACVVPETNGRGVVMILVVDRALGWRGWLDATLKASAIVEDDCRELDAVLDRLSE
jgi:hypothetical protein